MFKNLLSLLVFLWATSIFAQSPYGKILTLDNSGTQQWIDIMEVLSNYSEFHSTTAQTVWLTNGNYLTDPGTLGSNTNQPLIFITNGYERMRITQTGKICIGTENPHSSAILDITSNSNGILLPRLTTTERDGISSPATGLLIYNTTKNSFDYFVDGNWQSIAAEVPFSQITSGTNTSAEMIVSSPATLTTIDAAFTITDNSETPGYAKFEASGITAGSTKTYNFQNTSGTIALLESSQTWSGAQTFGRSVHFSVTTVDEDTDLNNSHFFVKADATNGDVTINLPQASTCTGRMYIIIRIDDSSNNVILHPYGEDTIDEIEGDITFTSTEQWIAFYLISDGSNWIAWISWGLGGD